MEGFDTLEWKAFDNGRLFFSKFFHHSAKLSVLVNGKSFGYFSCVRGVCQADPLR
jgi:hypothetical protein